MMQVAKDAGLSRESLYKALRPGAHPRFETVQAVLRALGVKLAMSAGPLAHPSEDDLPSIVRVRNVVLGKGKVVRAMALPEVSEKITKRSYRRSGVVRSEPIPLSRRKREAGAARKRRKPPGKWNRERRRSQREAARAAERRIGRDAGAQHDRLAAPAGRELKR